LNEAKYCTKRKSGDKSSFLRFFGFYRISKDEKKYCHRQTNKCNKLMRQIFLTLVSKGVASEQQAEIKRLRNEINRLSMFRSTVRNYQEENSEEQEVIPSDMLAVSYNNE